MPATVGCGSQGQRLKSNVTTWLRAGDCRFRSGNLAVWGTGPRSFRATPGSSADACVSTLLSPGLVCNHWLRWAQCPEQSEVSLNEARQASPVHRCAELTWPGGGHAVSPLLLGFQSWTPPCASWSGGRGAGGSRALAPPLLPGQWGAPPAGPGFTQLLV